VLVALLEHGLTNAGAVARSTYTAAPEQIQGAVAAGLLAVPRVDIEELEELGAIFEHIRADIDSGKGMATVVTTAIGGRTSLPGYRQAAESPRVVALLDVLELNHPSGTARAHARALAGAFEAATGIHVSLNVHGAVAVALSDLGVPASLFRGFAVIGDTTTLVAHANEERIDPIAPALQKELKKINNVVEFSEDDE
jgi:citrate synthase